MNVHVAALVARLQEQPSHTGSLIITLFGDVLMPRGGGIALSNIIALMEPLGIGPGVVRTAISRLSADGWLVSTRQSRASFYRISPARRGEFVRASRHIYGPPRRAAARNFILAMPESIGRDAVRERFGRLGFVAWQGMLLAPERPLPRSLEAETVVLKATGSAGSLQRLAARAWRLDTLAELYRAFITQVAPLTGEIASFGPRDALLARLLLIHDYRRIILRDPRLPAAFLPADWAGTAARRSCARLYEGLLDGSETWVDENALTETGALPPPSSALRHRFADMREGI